MSDSVYETIAKASIQPRGDDLKSLPKWKRRPFYVMPTKPDSKVKEDDLTPANSRSSPARIKFKRGDQTPTPLPEPTQSRLVKKADVLAKADKSSEPFIAPPSKAQLMGRR